MSTPVVPIIIAACPGSSAPGAERGGDAVVGAGHDVDARVGCRASRRHRARIGASTLNDRVNSGVASGRRPAARSVPPTIPLHPRRRLSVRPERHRRVGGRRDHAREAGVQVVHRLEVGRRSIVDLGLRVEPQHVPERRAGREAMDSAHRRAASPAASGTSASARSPARAGRTTCAAARPARRCRRRARSTTTGWRRTRRRSTPRRRLRPPRSRPGRRRASASRPVRHPARRLRGRRTRPGCRVSPEPSTAPSIAITDALHAVVPRSIASALPIVRCVVVTARGPCRRRSARGRRWRRRSSGRSGHGRRRGRAGRRGRDLCR